MNDYPAKEFASRATLGQINPIDYNPTVEENINSRIEHLQAEIDRLKMSKENLGPLLNMRIRDIRSAMDFF